MKSSHTVLFCTLVAALSPAGAFAQSAPPDAGSLQREQQGKLQLPPASANPLPQAGHAAANAAGDNGTRVQVQGFRIEGNTGFSSEKLLALLDDLKGKSLSLSDLDAAAQRIGDYYHAHGWLLGRAYVPAQRSDDGIIVIAVAEGRYGKFTIDNRSHLRDDVVQSALLPFKAGAPVQVAPLEKQLLLLDDQPGASVRTQLAPGANVGESDLHVEVAPTPRYAGSVYLDNSGNPYTGRYLLGAQFTLAEPAGLGDALAVDAQVSDQRQVFGHLRYDLAMPGSVSTRIGVQASRMDYQLAGDFDALDGAGTADDAGVFVRHDFIRSRRFNLHAELDLDARRLHDSLYGDQIVTEKHADTRALEIGGDWHGAHAVDAFDLHFTHGDIDLNKGQADPSALGSFNALQAQWLHLQGLSARDSLYFSVNAQSSLGHNLDSSQKLVAGGPDAVRAYPVGEAPSDEGAIGTLEFRHALSAQWQWKAFVDAAYLNLQRHPLPGEDNHRNLSGVGLGASWQPLASLLVDASVAMRTGDAAQSDDDSRVRLWVQGRWSF